MNEYSRALEALRKYNKLAKFPVASIHGAMEMQIGKLQKLVDKSERTEPIKFSSTYEGVEILKYECPECGGLLTPYHDYCSFCGQKIDWDECDEI